MKNATKDASRRPADRVGSEATRRPRLAPAGRLCEGRARGRVMRRAGWIGWLGALGMLVGTAGCAARGPVAPPSESGGIDRPRAATGATEREADAAPGEADVSAPTESILAPPFSPPAPPLTATASLGRYDARRDASLRLVIGGLDADAAGEKSRALASYQRAVRLDATNPIAFLALARHHIAAGDPEEASAFLDQARALFESEGEQGPAVDVWGLGLRGWIDRALGRDLEADSRFEAARELSPEIWRDELLSADEMR